jgi:acyl-CoA reductase-like NAD-dependent aldehyde dehydrogenase
VTTRKKPSDRRRVDVLKTYKLFVGGEFIRSESGRAYQPAVHGAGGAPINVARASRKDLRAAVSAARKAQPGWAGRTAYLRGQILYRVAEMLEGRRAQFVEEIARSTGDSRRKAEAEVTAAVDRAVWYAGWADKFQTTLGTMNPVAAPYFNFSVAEPTGIVGVVAPAEMPLLGLVSTLWPVVVSGNAAVAIVSEAAPLPALTFAEVLATSDVPPGVVNLLSGFRSEILPHLAKHMDVAGIFLCTQDEAEAKLVQEEGAENVKRIRVLREPRGDGWLDESAQSPLWIEPFVEIKTIWHPIGV